MTLKSNHLKVTFVYQDRFRALNFSGKQFICHWKYAVLCQGTFIADLGNTESEAKIVFLYVYLILDTIDRFDTVLHTNHW